MGTGAGGAEATERFRSAPPVGSPPAVAAEGWRACANGRRTGTELFFLRRRLSFPRKPFCGSGDMKSARDELFDDCSGAVDGEGATAGAGGAVGDGLMTSAIVPTANLSSCVVTREGSEFVARSSAVASFYARCFRRDGMTVSSRRLGEGLGVQSSRSGRPTSYQKTPRIASISNEL